MKQKKKEKVMFVKMAVATMLKALMFVMILLASGVFVISSQAEESVPVISIGVVYDGNTALYDTHFDVLKNEIITLTTGEFDVRFDKGNIINGQWDRATVKASVAGLLNDPDVDLVLCLGVMSSTEICTYNELPKPAIASSVFNALVARTGGAEKAGGIKNLNYILSTGDFRKCLGLFRELVSFNHLAIVVDKNVTEGIPEFETVYSDIGRELNTEISFIKAESTSVSVLTAIPEETDAVVVAPLLSFESGEYSMVVKGLRDMNMPAFSMLGKNDVGKGFLGGLSSGVESLKLLRRIAINVQRILLGETPESLPTGFSEEEKLVINMETARLIGLSPNWTVLSSSEIINEYQADSSLSLTLDTVLREAEKNNPDMEAGRRMVASGKQEVKKARASLAPSVDLETTGVVIDENRAELSFGTESERKWGGSVNATQVLYSEKAWGGWASVKHVQSAREEEFETIRLDLYLDVAKTYINVLRARTLERIRKTNLKLTQANLERAKMRRSVGTAGASEVYRWESELARHRKEVILAEVTVSQSKNALKRILGKSQSEMISVSDVTLADPVLLTSDKRFIESINTPRKFSVFQDFMVREGLKVSPELKQLGYAIQASDRMSLTSQRAYWVPDVVMQGNVSDVFDRSGFSQVADARDKTAWSVAVNASFSLFTGGEKTAEYLQSREEGEKLRSQRKAVSDRLEERIRYTIQQARATYAGISLSKDAADAARKNLNLVTDAYSRGVLSIIDLLDAQNASMMADLGAENAVYDFIIDALTAQRAIGCVDYSEITAKDSLYDRLITFMNNYHSNG